VVGGDARSGDEALDCEIVAGRRQDLRGGAAGALVELLRVTKVVAELVEKIGKLVSTVVE
jgi:hypothetical protein